MLDLSELFDDRRFPGFIVWAENIDGDPGPEIDVLFSLAVRKRGVFPADQCNGICLLYTSDAADEL